MADLFENPMGLMGFEFVEFASPDARHARAGVREARLHAGRASTAPRTWSLYRQGDINFIVNREPKSLAGVLRRRARPVGLRPGVSRQGCAQGLRARAGARRAADRDADRPDGAAPAGDQGHRRRAAVPDRPLRGRQVDLRHRLRVPRRRRPPPGRPRPEAHRPPDAQRLSRPHGVLGRASTRSCSTSARSATSTSRASTPA